MTQAEWLISRWEKLQSEGEKMSWDDIISITKLSLELPQQEKSEKPINLEISDEEINEEAVRYRMTNPIITFKSAIKWYREQLKQRQ